jgi:hypothetical protein
MAPNFDHLHAEELLIVIWRPIYSNDGATKSLGLGLLPSSTLLANDNCCGYSIIAQLHLQGKLTMPRRETQKIRHENKMLKANEPTSYV